MGDRPGRSDALNALVQATVGAHRDAHGMKAAGSVVPAALLENWRFRRGDGFPLTLLAVEATHVVRPLGKYGAALGGRDLPSSENWQLALADQDIE